MRWRARLAVAAVAALMPAAATAEGKLINPCRFSSHDAPCTVEGGSYRALVPQGLGPHPAVVYLYGSLGQSDVITGSGYFQRTVVRRGYALIAPNALDVAYVGGRRGTGWGRKARRSHPRDDREFLARVLADARARFNIDRNRLIFVGQSDGGFFIWEIACERPDMAAAYAVHAASFGWRLPDRCRAPVRFLQGHGRRDRVVPFEAARNADGAVMGVPVPQALALMARSARCGGDPVGERLHGFERLRWTGCAPGAGLDRLIHDGGHGWPRDWMPAVLDWFEERRLRPAEAVTRRVGDGALLSRGGDAGTFRRAPVPAQPPAPAEGAQDVEKREDGAGPWWRFGLW